MATWRRIALLAGLSLAIWLFFHVSLEPLVTVQLADFARMQEGEGGFFGFSTEKQEYLKQLSLQEYIAEKTRDRTVSVSGEQWETFFREVAAASAGETSDAAWTRRLSPEETRRHSTPYWIFFRTWEKPVAEISDRVTGQGPDSFFVRLDQKGQAHYLELRARSFSSDDFQLGTGLLGSPRPPSSFLYPQRPAALWALLAALAAYFLIPWKKRDPEALCYPYWLVALGDFVAMILFVPFFGLPMFVIGGSVQALTTPAIFLTVIMWPFALAGAWLSLYMAEYESYLILIHDDGLELQTCRRHDSFAFDAMDHWELLELRPPRWLIALLWLASLTGQGARSAQAAGQAAMLSGTSMGGVGIWLKNGSAVFLWITAQMGRRAKSHFQRLLAALEAALIPHREEVKVIRSVIMPEGEGEAVAASSRYRDWTLWAIILAPLVAVGGAALCMSVGNTVRKVGRVIGLEREPEPVGSPPTLGELSATGVVWEKTIRLQDATIGQSLIATADKGFLIAGVTWQPGGSQQLAAVVRTDRDGEVVWSKTYGDTRINQARNIVAVNDGAYILLGYVADRVGIYADQKMSIRRIDAEGNLLWERAWSKDEDDRPTACDAVESEGGGVVIWGHSDRAIHRLQLNRSGDITSAHTYDMSDQVGEGKINWLSATVDGGSIVTGETLNPDGGYKDLLLLKLAPDGQVAWKRAFGGKRKESGTHVRQLDSGGFVAAGSTQSGESRDPDVYMVLTDADGNPQWKQTIVKPGEQSVQRVSITPERSFLVVGESRPDPDSGRSLFFVELGPDGTSTQTQQITRENATYTGADAIAASDGTRLLLGSRSLQKFKEETMLIKLKKEWGHRLLSGSPVVRERVR